MNSAIKKQNLSNLVIFLLVGLLFLNQINNVIALTSSEIVEEKRKQEEKLAQTESEIARLNSEIAGYSSDVNIAQASIPELENQIKKIEALIEVNKLEIEQTQRKKELTKLKKEETELLRRESVKSSYFDWRIDVAEISTLFVSEFDNKMSEFFSTAVVNKTSKDIIELAQTIDNLESDIQKYNKENEDLKKQNSDLEYKKNEVMARIAYLNSIIAGNNSSIGNLQSEVKTLQSNISFLSEQQRVAEERERQLLENDDGGESGPGNSFDTSDGTVPFAIFGRGRDLYQGHGVGLSQWGAHGFALNGFDYNYILRFYYTGVDLSGGYEGATVNVDGYGAINIEDYVAGQEEIAGRACGSAEQALARPDKYVVDNPNSMWDCWPEEAIKAFAITYRTYGYFYRGFLYRDGRSQVYNGTGYTRWAADETRGIVITYGGAPIEALYSSDNNQGFGTANNDTRFQSYSGAGTPYPYLRSVNDNSMATRTAYTDFTYRTGNYDISHINSMIDFGVSRPDIVGGLSGYLAGLKNTIGNQAASFIVERDPSNRADRVKFMGYNGSTAYLGGYWFKYLWNEWSYAIGANDYLYSQTYFFQSI